MFKKVTVFIFLLVLISPTVFAASPYEDTNRFAYGFKRIFAAPFQIPIRALQGTFQGPLGLGTVSGALQGTYYTLGEFVGGIFDMGAAAAPYAKYAVFI